MLKITVTPLGGIPSTHEFENIIDAKIFLESITGIELSRDAEQRNEAETGTGSDKPDRASYDGGAVYFNPECIFNYCPTPGLCKARGCQHRAESA